jgi:hypothetical protein
MTMIERRLAKVESRVIPADDCGLTVLFQPTADDSPADWAAYQSARAGADGHVIVVKFVSPGEVQ